MVEINNKNIENNEPVEENKVLNTFFINEDLHAKFRVKLKTLEELIEMINLKLYEEVTIRYIFDTMRQLPASIRGYHGNYSGGLWDHVLLVTNIALLNYNTINIEDFSVIDTIKTALYHDFEKVIRYAPKKKVQFNFKVYREEQDTKRYYIQDSYFLKGKDYHVEVCLALLDKAKIKVNETIEKGIIFHHGGWSQFFPKKSFRISALIHGADMLASQTIGV